MIYNPPLPRINFSKLILKLKGEQRAAALCPFCLKRPVDPDIILSGLKGIICYNCWNKSYYTGIEFNDLHSYILNSKL